MNLRSSWRSLSTVLIATLLLLFTFSYPASAGTDKELQGLSESDSAAILTQVRKAQWVDSNWVQTAKNASGNTSGALFGYSVAIDGDFAVVGSNQADRGFGGAAYILQRFSGGWVVIHAIFGPGTVFGDRFGDSVAISGDTIVVGDGYESSRGINQGAAYVYSRNQGGADKWGLVKTLRSSATYSNNGYFGYSVAISGDMIAVGAQGEDSFTGAAYIYYRNLGGTNNWGENKRIVLAQVTYGDMFGTSVALSPNGTLVVGAQGTDTFAGADQGMVYLFGRYEGGNDNWGKIQQMTSENGGANNYFGNSVAISSTDTIIVGAPGYASNTGAAYIYNLGSWGVGRQIMASDQAVGDQFGYSVAISGDSIVVGAYNKNINGKVTQGAAYVYSRVETRNPYGTFWGEVRKLTASDGLAGDLFGFRVAISGDTIISGTPRAEANGYTDQGAVYFYWNAYTAAMPVPTGHEGFVYFPVMEPHMSFVPDQAAPLALADPSASTIFQVYFGLGPFSARVDIYNAFSLSTDPNTIYIMNPDGGTFNTFTRDAISQALSTGQRPEGLVPWRSNTLGDIKLKLMEMERSQLPNASITVYTVVFPAGSLNTYYMWQSVL